MELKADENSIIRSNLGHHPSSNHYSANGVEKSKYSNSRDRSWANGKNEQKKIFFLLRKRCMSACQSRALNLFFSNPLPRLPGLSLR